MTNSVVSKGNPLFPCWLCDLRQVIAKRWVPGFHLGDEADMLPHIFGEDDAEQHMFNKFWYVIFCYVMIAHYQ